MSFTVPKSLINTRKTLLAGTGLLIGSSVLIFVNQAITTFYIFIVLYSLAVLTIFVSSIMALVLSRKHKCFWFRGKYFIVNEESKLIYTRFRYRTIGSLVVLGFYCWLIGKIALAVFSLI